MRRPTEPTELLAPAKLTLSLHITGVRADGYHLVEAQMVSVDLCDRLLIQPLDAPQAPVDASQALEGDPGPQVDPRPQIDVVMLDESGKPFRDAPKVGDNLVTKALRLAGRSAAVKVYKRIPMGAGLGGGSTDAAAVLRWAGFSDEVAAARLGADVAFCLAGGRSRVSGIGEIIEPLPYREHEQYTLVLPPIHCPTANVYRAWDKLGGPIGPNGNDLEAAAVYVAPELARWRDDLGDATGLTPRLAGSGSTWFVQGAHPGSNRLVVSTMPRSRRL